MRVLRTSMLLAGLLLLGSVVANATDTKTFDEGRAGFWVAVDDLVINYRVFAVSVMPGAEIVIETSKPSRLITDDQPSTDPRTEWTWTAPQDPGVHTIGLGADDDVITLHFMVMTSASRQVDGSLLGYKIGQYPDRPLPGLENYMAPTGFIVVTPENRHLQISPHFTLGQFLCKQESGWPKLVVVQARLLLKLERILAEVNLAGIRTDSFVVMSGYRTPWYNRAIGNRTVSSRHLFGGAADIYVDVDPVDGQMDDLNGDGIISEADAEFLFNLLQGWSDKPWWNTFKGGMAAYGSTAAHGPFVHVDERGYPARWNR